MREKHLLLLLLLLAAVVFLGWQNVVELRGEEPRRAVVSMEMLFSRSFVVPQLNGWTYYNKPPLFNWVLILFFQLFQRFDEWVVRLPSLLSCFAIAGGQFWMMRRYYDRRTALLGAFFFLFGAEILLYATPFSGEIDLFFSLLICLQVWSIYYFFEKKQYWALFLLSYLFTALGVLTKGLPALPFQAFTLLALFVWKGRWKMLFGIQHISGILLLALIVGTYLWAFNQEAAVWLFIVRQYKEAAQRTGLENQWFSVLLGAGLVPLELLKLLLPGSLFGLFLLSKRVRQAVFSSDFARFSLLFILVNFPLYWFSGDFKPRYVYMFFPFFSGLFAVAAVQGLEAFQKTGKGIFIFWKRLTLLFPIALLSLLLISEIQGLPNFFLRLGFLLLLAVLVAVLAWQSKWWLWSV
ncbi:MAG: glycosyltransferase family 39 protein, partial [Phaeodactylibacter sp.]|nr:glycosyltransferase family 39 protein [Phaeodactylibacter sp.]